MDWYGLDSLDWELDEGTTYMIGMSFAAGGNLDLIESPDSPPWGSFGGMFAIYSELGQETITGAPDYPAASVGFRFNSDC